MAFQPKVFGRTSKAARRPKDTPPMKAMVAAAEPFRKQRIVKYFNQPDVSQS